MFAELMGNRIFIEINQFLVNLNYRSTLHLSPNVSSAQQNMDFYEWFNKDMWYLDAMWASMCLRHDKKLIKRISVQIFNTLSLDKYFTWNVFIENNLFYIY